MFPCCELGNSYYFLTHARSPTSCFCIFPPAPRAQSMRVPCDLIARERTRKEGLFTGTVANGVVDGCSYTHVHRQGAPASSLAASDTRTKMQVSSAQERGQANMYVDYTNKCARGSRATKRKRKTIKELSVWCPWGERLKTAAKFIERLLRLCTRERETLPSFLHCWPITFRWFRRQTSQPGCKQRAVMRAEEDSADKTE